MKHFFFFLLFIPIVVNGQISKKSLIENTLLAMERVEDVSYKSVVSYIEKTPADKTLIWENPLFVTYKINPYDTLCYMNFK